MSVQIKLPMVTDVSYYEPVSDWSLCDPRPLSISARTSYGMFLDSHFQSHMQQAHDLGIGRMAWHYFYAVPLLRGQTAEECVGDQADNMVKQMKLAAWKSNEPMWLDWEATGNTAAPAGVKLQVLIKQFVDHVEREMGFPMEGFYSRKDQLARMLNTWKDKLRNPSLTLGVMPPWFHNYKLWIAWYPDRPNDFDQFPLDNTRVFASWLRKENVALWQYSEDAFLVPKEGMADRHVTTFDVNMIFPWYMAKLGLENPPETPTKSIGDKLLADAERLKDSLLAIHVKDLIARFPEVLE